MKKWALKIFLSAVGMTVIAAGVYAFSANQDEPETLEAIYTPDTVEVIDVPDETIYTPAEVDDTEIDLSTGETISMLLLGVDTGDFGRDEQGLPDSIIVVTINPEEQATKMVSIPRDTKTEMVGMYFNDKINHAYAFGGTQMMVNSVENLLDIPIDYYVRVDMGGFQALVDAVGGVEVENDLEFTFDGTQFPIGSLYLTGADALKFTRMRDDDPRGDFGRQQRQLLVIEALIDEMTSFSSMAQFVGIIDVMGEHLETNADLNDAAAMLFGGYREAFANIEQLELLVGEGQIINGIYYQILSDEEIANARAVLRSHLGLEVEEASD